MTKKVVVAGGFGALGRAVVEELNRRGFRVAVVDMASAPADWVARPGIGGVDLAEPAAVADAYARIAADGPIDALVNVAGGFVWEPISGGDISNFDRMFRMNLRTAATSCQAVLPHLADKGASIVNIGAFAANQAATGMGSYAASKAGVRALTESLADELRGKGVRVNAVLPTIIDTPVNRKDMPDADFTSWVSPLSAANVIAFLISDDSAAITGAAIPLSVGG